jgi:hypothetical protein
LERAKWFFSKFSSVKDDHVLLDVIYLKRKK